MDTNIFSLKIIITLSSAKFVTLRALTELLKRYKLLNVIEGFCLNHGGLFV